MNSVLIPCYRRPEFLQVNLELIAKNPSYRKHYYVFALDYRFRRPLLNVIDRFKVPHKELLKTPRTSYTLTKQSYNLLSGYKRAKEVSDGLVFMIEEDVFVANDFFAWHETIHEQEEDIFCSIGTRNNNHDDETTGKLNEYYLRKGDYQSLGVAFKVSVMDSFLRHANSSYFENPVEYCANHFPNSSIGPFFVEQDGLIRRVLEESGKNVAFPHHPRAFHAGWYGKNRGTDRLTGTVQNKVNEVKRVCFSKDLMRQYAPSEAAYRDSIPVDLDNEGTWQTLKLV